MRWNARAGQRDRSQTDQGAAILLGPRCHGQQQLLLQPPCVSHNSKHCAILGGQLEPALHQHTKGMPVQVTSDQPLITSLADA